MDEHRELWWPSPSADRVRVVRLDLDRPFETVGGARLEAIQVGYESWGTLDERRANAVLVIHPLAMDSHAAGDEDPDAAPGWWEGLIGPGCAIDTRRCHVVCPNLLGGCYGTTGPRHPAPDGAPYLERFPLLAPRDIMRACRLFARAVGIQRLHTVIGPSMGAMIAWEWAIEAGDEVGQVIVVAAPPQTTADQIGLNWLQRRALELERLQGEPGLGGRKLARGVGMLSYRAPDGLEQKFGRGWFKRPGATLAEPGTFNVESWLGHHGTKSARRFDPYTYRLFARAMDLHDVADGRGGFAEAARAVRCPVVVVGIDSDRLYPARDVRRGAEALRAAGVRATYEELASPHGHDAFLLETEQLAAILGRAPVPLP